MRVGKKIINQMISTLRLPRCFASLAMTVFLAMTMLILVALPAHAESLFTSGVSKTGYTTTPRSLYSTVKAKSIRDFVTVILEEEVSSSDDLKLDVSDESVTTDSFSTLLDKILPGNPVPSELNNFGGKNTTGNSAKMSRTTKYSDTVTAQVVQVLPNGNLVIQGKKTAINAGDRVNLVISGIIDPRFIDSSGQIKSSQVFNLQFASTGKGTISGSQNEGVINKFIRHLF